MAQTDTPLVESKLRLFISYRRQDLASEALRLRCTLLRDPRVGEVFLDVDEIREGEAWLRRIMAALARSHCILCLIGPGFRPERLEDRKDFVRFELLHRRLPLLPLLFEASMPDARSLPHRLRARLATVNAVTIYDWEETERLLEALARVLEEHQRRQRPRERALMGVIAASLAVVVFRVFQRFLGEPVAIWACLVASLVTIVIALHVALQGVRRGYLADGLAGGLAGVLVLLSFSGNGLLAAVMFLPVAIWIARLRS